MAVFYTPRFSYRVVKTVICACPGVLVLVPVGRGVRVGGVLGACREGYQGGYTGWVIPGPSTIPSQLARQGADPEPAERAPEALAGAGVGGFWGWDRPLRVVPGTSAQPRTHPSGPVGPPAGALPGTGLGSSGKGRDSYLNSVKLVKTAECHRKVFKRPVIVPIFKNGSQSSPLDFLGFPVLPAFSPKELMGLF